MIAYLDGREAARGNAQPILGGDPVGAVVAFANAQPAAFGGLAAGQILTTGTTTGAPLLGDARDVRADFGALGEVRVRFS